LNCEKTSIKSSERTASDEMVGGGCGWWTRTAEAKTRELPAAGMGMWRSSRRRAQRWKRKRRDDETRDERDESDERDERRRRSGDGGCEWEVLRELTHHRHIQLGLLIAYNGLRT
jgi:hypothetical protein